MGACGRLVLPLWYWLAGITGVSKLIGVALRVTYFTQFGLVLMPISNVVGFAIGFCLEEVWPKVPGSPW